MKFTVRQSFDSVNQTTIQAETVSQATAWINRERRTHPLATYSIYRNSTDNLVAQWEGGKRLIR